MILRLVSLFTLGLFLISLVFFWSYSVMAAEISERIPGLRKQVWAAKECGRRSGMLRTQRLADRLLADRQIDGMDSDNLEAVDHHEKVHNHNEQREGAHTPQRPQ